MCRLTATELEMVAIPHSVSNSHKVAPEIEMPPMPYGKGGIVSLIGTSGFPKRRSQTAF